MSDREESVMDEQRFALLLQARAEEKLDRQANTALVNYRAKHHPVALVYKDWRNFSQGEPAVGVALFAPPAVVAEAREAAKALGPPSMREVVGEIVATRRLFGFKVFIPPYRSPQQP